MVLDGFHDFFGSFLTLKEIVPNTSPSVEINGKTSRKQTTTTKASAVLSKPNKRRIKKDAPSAEKEDVGLGRAQNKTGTTKPKAIEMPPNNDGGSVFTPSSLEEKNTDVDDDDRAACCLCHCALDFSDRAAFFQADRQKEAQEHENNASSDEASLYYQPTDPYVPQNLYDPYNALVYCDGCNRLYHQKCHFVPLMVVPRGSWNCLVCTTSQKMTNTQSKRKTNGKKSSTQNLPFTKAQLKRMFQSPPPPAKQQQLLTEEGNAVYHTRDEKEWEVHTRHAKAVLWHKTLTQTLPNSISSALSNWRQAQTAFETLTRTRKNRQYFLESSTSSSRGSQELAQTLVKMSGAKLRMRQIVMNLEQIRLNPERHIRLIDEWCQGILNETKTNRSAAAKASSTTGTAHTARPPPKSFLERVVFPFGQYPARSIPRTAEMEEIEEEEANALQLPQTTVVKGNSDIPQEIVTTTAASTSTETITSSGKCNGNKKKTKTDQVGDKKPNKKSKKGESEEKEREKQAGKHEDSDSSNSSGISLDDLVCCICLIGDATDENDLLLCDGKGCFRAYHMNCLEPRVTQEEVEATEGEDWFCPLCTNLAECMHMIQSNTEGDEWDRRRMERDYIEAMDVKKKGNSGKDTKDDDDDDDDDDSLKSWDLPTQVFPRAQWEYDTALQLKAGNRNDETNALLQLFLGDGEDGQDGNTAASNMGDNDTDDEELDGHFDPGAYEEERRRQREEIAEDADDSSTHSSQATLVDMSSVELNIDEDELKALSEGSDSENNSDGESGSGEDSADDKSETRQREKKRGRRSRRLRRKDDAPKNIGADYDISNIVQGKRRRNRVDYRKLNEALFGELDESDLANIDDTEDFRVVVPKKKVSSSSSSGEEDSGEDDDDDGSGSDSDGRGSESDSDSASNKEEERKMKRNKRKRSRSSVSDGADTDSGNEAENEDSSVGFNAKKKARKAKTAPAKRKKRTASKIAKGSDKSGKSQRQKTDVSKNEMKTSSSKVSTRITTKSKDKTAKSTSKKRGRLPKLSNRKRR